MLHDIAIYLDEISRLFSTGAATEHSYRPALQRLLADVIPCATVVNEPARIECGAPDILVRENGPARRPVGYVEAKDIGDGDLDGNGPHKEQFDRYKAELSNIVFTDYLDFHFYEDGQFVAKCRVAEVAGSRIVPASPEELERFSGLLRHFAEVAPKRISSPARLAHLMAGKARLLARAVAATLKADAGLESAIGAQMQAFRQWLVHDLDAESFADVYAQTIVYGMFAARFHDTTPEDFSRTEAASLIPRSNPLLRRLFRDLDEYVDESIVWIIDDLVALFAASDVNAILKDYGKSTAQTDPLLHFYEDFLAAYNPTLRKQRGVWYTPAPVVRFIVRSVDAILRRDFNLPAGLADASMTRVKVVNDNKVRKSDAKFLEREVHRVQILDPAAGTGTFLAETVRHIRAKFAGQEGMWPGYVRDHLVPRLNGFEILMASYAMAHLKLDMLLSEEFSAVKNPEGSKSRPCDTLLQNDNARLRVFLTNSLEEFSETTGTLWAMELSNESREADFIKRDCPVMVVMGNPPYSVSSSNKGEWIQRLVADYKKGLGEKKINLDDDYIKFIRLGQHYIDRNGEGILAYISNNSFLDGITHRQMRKSLLESFDEIYILDLHGNARKKETAPDGSKDENVFDIMQGVSINIFVKRGKDCFNAETQRRREVVAAKNVKIAKVFHAEVFGEREAKYGFLDAHDLATVEYKELSPQAPYYFFVPKDFALQEEYDKGFSVAELMPVNNSGIQTKRDKLVYNFSRQDIEKVVGVFKSEDVEFIRNHYSLPADGRDWAVAWAKEDVSNDDGTITQVAYHPFDKRWTYFSGRSSGLMAYPRMPQSAHLLHDNIALLLVRNTRRENPFNFFVVDTIVDKDGISGFDNCRFFPLYLYTDDMGKVEKRANLDKDIVAKIAEIVANDNCHNCSQMSNTNLDSPTHPLSLSQLSTCSTRSTRLNNPPSPEDIFHYIYAVLHTPQYRERYREFLKVDFPRIPYPKNAESFRRLAAIGESLVQVHLLKDPKVRDMFSPYANFPIAGGNRVDAIELKLDTPADSASLRLCVKKQCARVYINSTQYFDNVPVEAWEFYVGGYQPAQKWLKDRKGRALSSDDIMHYKSIIAALVETRRLMDELWEATKEEPT